jgi:glycosyltransferase involved in cell wall biosynthesis
MLPRAPELSVVIPSFNRAEPLKYTLRSVACAVKALGTPVEILVVDDGSSPPVREQLGSFDCGAKLTHLYQRNQGSIVARLTGLKAAQGDYVLFLDSDDLVHPEKFSRQVGAMRDAGADISYADMAVATLGAGYEVASLTPGEILAEVADTATFFIAVQPAPHNPIFLRSYLDGALAAPLVPVVRTMDPSGDVWLFYNLSVFPAKIIKVPGPLSAPGPHEEDRYSRHWEKLGVAALQIMECFMRACPNTNETVGARQAVGEAAFRTWRGLPRDFSATFTRRMLTVFRKAPHGPYERLGTPSFARAAAIVGPVLAGRLIRVLRARPYSGSRTLSDDEYRSLLGPLEAT